MNKMLKPDSRCFIVVGDVKGHKPLAKLLADVVSNNEEIGFSVKRIIIDEIKRNRRYLYGSNSQHIKTDRILELHKGSPMSKSTDVLLTS